MVKLPLWEMEWEEQFLHLLFRKGNDELVGERCVGAWPDGKCFMFVIGYAILGQYGSGPEGFWSESLESDKIIGSDSD